MKIVTPLRFERRTHSLEGCCSIQLSYPTILICDRKGNTNLSYSLMLARKISIDFNIILINKLLTDILKQKTHQNG